MVALAALSRGAAAQSASNPEDDPIVPIDSAAGIAVRPLMNGTLETCPGAAR